MHFLSREHRSDNEVPVGIFICSTDSTSVELAGAVGFDYVILEAEHVPLDRTAVLAHVRAAAASGIVPLVKVPNDLSATLQGYLDVGAGGVLVPQVESASAAARLVNACRYAPQGRRGMSFACHDGRYDAPNFSHRMAERNRDVLVIPMIETVQGIENVEQIADTDGIEALFFGPGDLAADMGIELTISAAPLQVAWQKFRSACQKFGKLALAPDNLGFEKADSYTVGIDLVFLRNAYANVLEEIRSRRG